MATVLLFLLYFGLLTAVVPSVMDMQHLALRPNTCCHRLWLEVKHDMSVVKRKKKKNNRQHALQEVHSSISRLTWNVMLFQNPHVGFPHKTHLA